MRRTGQCWAIIPEQPDKSYRTNGGHNQMNADYLHLKTAFLYGFSRCLTQSQKAEALRVWERLRPRRTPGPGPAPALLRGSHGPGGLAY